MSLKIGDFENIQSKEVENTLNLNKPTNSLNEDHVNISRNNNLETSM